MTETPKFSVKERRVIAGVTAEAVEQQLVEHAHNLAMSKNPVQATRGRFMKDVMPAYVRWLDAELQRPEVGIETLEGFAQALTVLSTTMAGNLARHGPSARIDSHRAAILAGAIKDLLVLQMDASIEAFAKGQI